MSTAIHVPVSEYLATSYRPDCEYIDGELKERNLGELDHGLMQMKLAFYLFSRKDIWHIHVIPELRVQVKKTRYRVPDLTVIVGSLPSARVLQDPPFLCIEILSRGDTLYEMQERIDDYLEFGVPHVWVIHPGTPRAYHYTASGMQEAKDRILRTTDPDIEIPILDLL